MENGIVKLVKLLINNFRCFCKDEPWVWTPNTDLTLIIGPNGSGKTAMIDAIDIVLNSEGRSNRALISEYDFPFCDTDKKIEIEVVLTELGNTLIKFDSAIEFYNEKATELITELDDKDESEYKRAIRIKFEASLNPEEGEIECRWIFPKFIESDEIEAEELTRKQHEAIEYFRINPSISAGAFTLNQYSALGRHLRKLKYRLGKLPDKMKPELKLPTCGFMDNKCHTCKQKKDCQPNPEESTERKTLGEHLGGIVSDAENMLSEDSWGNMKSGLGPRYGGLRSSLAAITLGLSPRADEMHSFIPFERLSSGEKYALSFSLAISQIPNASLPIVVMEEPETALYPAAIGQMISKLQSLASESTPQVIITSHSESVLRRFSLEHIYITGADKKIVAILDHAKDGIQSAVTTLIIPGSTSALFADKIVLMEGLGDAFVSGELDRIAGQLTSAGNNQDSFSSLGWTVFGAKGTKTISDALDFFKRLGKKTIVLLDNDSNGNDAAKQLISKVPTFMYKKINGNDVELEQALLHGLDAKLHDEIITSFQAYDKCSSCLNKDLTNCLSKSCSISKNKYPKEEQRKSDFQKICLDQYRETKTFPPAFKSLLEQIDSVVSGELIELEV